MGETTFVIGMGETIGIIGMLAAGFLGVWRASASQHEKINGKLDKHTETLCDIRTEQATINTNIEWIKKALDNPPTDSYTNQP